MTRNTDAHYTRVVYEHFIRKFVFPKHIFRYLNKPFFLPFMPRSVINYYCKNVLILHLRNTCTRRYTLIIRDSVVFRCSALSSLSSCMWLVEVIWLTAQLLTTVVTMAASVTNTTDMMRPRLTTTLRTRPTRLPAPTRLTTRATRNLWTTTWVYP